MGTATRVKIDDLVAHPEQAASLTAEERSRMIVQIAGLLAALSVPAPVVAPPDEDDQLLTVPEVAKLLQFDEAYVYEMARAGRLPVIRQGRYVRVRRSSLHAWLASQEDQGSARALTQIRRRKPATNGVA